MNMQFAWMRSKAPVRWNATPGAAPLLELGELADLDAGQLRGRHSEGG
jgi:hypothetical protein